MKKVYLGVIIFLCVRVAMAMDFDKEISLENCLSIPKCSQGVLSKGGWSSTDSGIRNSKIKDVRCVKKNGRANLGCMGLDIKCDEKSGCWIGCSDGWGCWTVYDQACRDMDLNLQDELKNFSFFEVWEKKASYFEINFPKEIWDLIQRAAQFEIDCFEKKPSNAKGPQGAVYNHCPDMNHPTQNCNPVKDFTKMYSKEILAKAKNALYKKWNGVVNAQSIFNINESPRNLFLLQGEFFSLKEALFDEYYNFVNDMSKSTSLPKEISNYIAQEKRLLVKSKKFFEQKCTIVGNESLSILDEKEKNCTRFNLTDRNYSVYEEKKNKRLKDIEREFWEKAQKQVNEAPLIAVGERSLINEYLNKYPNGDFVKQAKVLYEKTLAQEGFKEAKKDTLLGLSEKSLLQRYLSEYPQGTFAKHASSFLEKLLFSYSMSQIKSAPKEAVLPNSYPEQYLKAYPNGEYNDSLSIALELIYWNNYSADCSTNQTKSSCEPLLEFLKKFPNSSHLDSARVLLDKPMWNTLKNNECVFYEDTGCSKIEQYIEMIPKGMHIKNAEKILEKAKNNSEKRDLEKQQKAEREERAAAWFENEYQDLNEGCSFVAKKDRYDYEWGSDKAFPEKNGSLECIEKIDLTLDSLDTLNYKCVEIEKIIVKGGKIVNGKGFCVNANSDTLARRTFSSNGKFKTIYYFPYKIILSVNENGDYSINSTSVKLKDIASDKILSILSHAKRTSNLNYLYEIDNYEFEWTKNGQIKNIRITDYDGQNKVTGKLNTPLNAKGEKHGVSEIYTAATGNFKIEWNNGNFKRIFGGGKKLKTSLCPEHVCSNLIWELNKSEMIHHYVPTLESSRDTGYEGFENGWMLHYIAYLLGISINDALKIWSVL